MGSPAETITRAFAGDWHGTWGAIPTPGHSKRDRGTTVKDGDAGDVVFASFNGGDWRELKDECRRRGLLPECPSAEPIGINGGGGWRETGRYEYLDTDGAVAYRTVRKEKAGERKRFVAQRPDGQGGWINGLDRDIPRILYRLPAIKTAIGAAVLRERDFPIVYLVEGERKADKLAAWGMLATAVAFGARGWRDSYATDLDGCTVVILPDNDDEGRGFAMRAAASLEKASCRVVTLPLPGLADKEDVIDWAGDADLLRTLTDAALNPPVETFPIADLAAWANTTPEPKRFVMAGFIPEHEVTLFTGAGGTNKSTFGLQLAACSAIGLPMLGVSVQPGPALYVTAEDEDRENHWRLVKIAAAIGTSLDRLAGKLHVVTLRGRLNNELATFDAEGRLHVTAALKLLRNTLEATGAKLLTLDNVGHLFVGNENDRGQVTAFINLLYQLCRELGVTILLVAHPNKQFLQGNKAGNATSGSTAWLNAVRSQLMIERAEGLDPDARVLSLGKANYARPDQTLAFRWHDFALLRDEDLPADRRAEIAAVVRANAEDDAFLRCLAKATEEKRATSTSRSASNYAPRIFAAMTSGKGVTEQGFEAALERLLHRGTIRNGERVYQRDNRAWVTGLGFAPTLAPTPAPTLHEPCTNLHTAQTQNLHQPARTHPPYTTYNPGAAHGAAAPDNENGPNLSRAGSGMILAPGETGCEPVPGWDV